MNDKEKAKAYDEIIERAKTMLAAGEVMYGKENNASQLITDLIPELRESEDEMIRKKLIGIFTNQSLCDVYNLKSEDVLAYLEKQKEQKPKYSAYLDLASNEFEACMLRYLQSAV